MVPPGDRYECDFKPGDYVEHAGFAPGGKGQVIQGSELKASEVLLNGKCVLCGFVDRYMYL